MATEERLICANEALCRLRMLKKSKIDDPFFGGKRNTIWDLALNSAISRVKDCPTVDAAEVVHAQWEEWWPGDCALIMTGEEMLYQCSACTAKYGNVEGFRYCPHCGAFMDLEVSDDE